MPSSSPFVLFPWSFLIPKGSLPKQSHQSLQSRVCAFLWRWWSVFGSSMARCEACSGLLVVSRLISGFVLREMLSLTGLTLHAQRKRATRAKHVLNLFALKASQTGARQMLLDSQVQLKYLKFEELCRDCHLQRHSHCFDAVKLLSG